MMDVFVGAHQFILTCFVWIPPRLKPVQSLPRGQLPNWKRASMTWKVRESHSYWGFWGDLQHLWPKIFFFFNRTCRAQIILSASFKWTCKDAFSFIKWWFICWWTTSTSSYTVAKSLTWVLAWVLEEVSYFSITGIFFLWKRGFSTGTKCMETISLRQANKRPLLLKDKYSVSATKLQRQQRGQNVLIFFFLGQDRSVVEPQAAEFMDLLNQFYETFTKVLNAQSSPSNKKTNVKSFEHN